MPALPTILFSSFHSGADPQRQSWARFREQVNTRSSASLVVVSSPEQPASAARRPLASSGDGESGIWRLLAPNNRELARSSFLYGSFAAAHQHVIRLRGADALTSSTVAGPLAQSFGWFVAWRGVPVMTCTKWFGSVSSSNEAAQAALASFMRAVVSDAPLRSTTSGRRTTRAGRQGQRAAW